MSINKTEFFNWLKASGGLQIFIDRGFDLDLYEFEPPPMSSTPTVSQIVIEPVQHFMELVPVTLYDMCFGVVIVDNEIVVPPFEWPLHDKALLSSIPLMR